MPILVSSTFEISFFNGFAFVVFFLSLAGCDDEFDVAATTEKFYGDELIAVLFRASELGELTFGDEEFDVALGVGAKGEIIEPEFIIFQSDKGAFKLDVMIADEANFGARKQHAAG